MSAEVARAPGSRVRSGISAFLTVLDRIQEGALAACLLAIILNVIAGVISRYVFNNSFQWTEELGQWLFIWLIFVGINVGHRRGLHIALGSIDQFLPSGLRHLRGVLAGTIVAYTMLMLLFGSWDLTWLLGGVSTGLQWPQWTRTIIVPAACVVGLIYILFDRIDEPETRLIGPLAVAAAIAAYAATEAFGVIRFPGTSPSLVMATAFLASMALGVPVGFALLFGTFLATLGAELLSPAAVVLNMVNGASKFILLAIPLFLTAGYLMNAGDLTRRLMDFAHSLVGHLRGGLAQVNVVASMLFGGVSGSSTADAAVDSKILVPQMVRQGYSPEFSCAITSASAILPNIIPPSIAMLIYAAAADASVGRLFIAGIGTGLALTVVLLLTVHVISVRRGYGRGGQRATARQRVGAFVSAVPVLMIAVWILGGIRFGIVTATEAAVLAVLWAAFLGVYYRAYHWRDLYQALVHSGIDAALVGFIIAVAAPFAWVLISERIPQEFVALVSSFVESRWATLLLVNLLLLIAGCFLDLSAAVLILVPIFLPLLPKLGIDPIHFGIIVIVNMMIGGITPPFGVLVFVTASITRTPTAAVFRECLPFVVTLVLGLLLITYVPAISMALVYLVY